MTAYRREMKNKCRPLGEYSRSKVRSTRGVYTEKAVYFSPELIRETRAYTRVQFYLFNLSNYSMTKRNEIMNELSSATTERSMPL